MADESLRSGEFLSKISVIFDKVPYALTFNRVIGVPHFNPMGFKYRLHQLLGGSVAAALIFTGLPVFAAELENWSFDTTNSELTFSLSDTVFPEFFLLSEPPRLVLDIPATEIGNVEPEQMYNGVVQSIRVAQHTSEQVRVVIELAADIVLAPEQADIQFNDDGDGQRHWRFRPLIVDRVNASSVSTDTMEVGTDAPKTVPSVRNGLSLSAANLELSRRPSPSTALPLDPYDADDALTSVVSVPPLEDAPDITGDTSSMPVAVVTVPDLPPMTVPDLEESTSLSDSSDNGLQPNIVIDTVEERSSELSVLPEIEPIDTPDDAEEPVIADVEPPAQLDEVAAGLENADLPLETPVIDMPEVTTAVEPLEVVSVEKPLEESSPIRSTETALAPVNETAVADFQSSSGESSPVEGHSAPAPQTIQQPAANRTIIQTDAPAPLIFGQPLPGTH